MLKFWLLMHFGSLVLRHAIVRRANSSPKSKVDAPDEEF
jgi:hypothetical protein